MSLSDCANLTVNTKHKEAAGDGFITRLRASTTKVNPGLRLLCLDLLLPKPLVCALERERLRSVL